MGLVGRRTGGAGKMGDAVQVRLSRVDLTQRQIDFELVETGAAPAPHGTVRGAAPGPRRRGAGAAAGSDHDAAQAHRAGRRGAAVAADVAERQTPPRLRSARGRRRHRARARAAARALDGRAAPGCAGAASLQGTGAGRGHPGANRRAASRSRNSPGEVAHQGAVAAVRPLKPWDEHDLVGCVK